MSEQGQIRAIVERRGVESLYHFTPLSNLPSILTHGLFSREQLEFRGLSYAFTDDFRLDRRLDYISLSVSFPNHLMFDQKQALNPERRWAVIEIDPAVLWQHYCLFFPQNAACSENINRAAHLCHCPSELEAMFPEYDSYTSLSFNPQAEVMVKSSIGLNSIKSVSVMDCGRDFSQIIGEGMPALQVFTLKNRALKHITFRQKRNLFQDPCRICG